jgi:hypothetical protein
MLLNENIIIYYIINKENVRKIKREREGVERGRMPAGQLLSKHTLPDGPYNTRTHEQ